MSKQMDQMHQNIMQNFGMYFIKQYLLI